MLKLAKALPALLLLTCALCATEARADTFVINGGAATVGSGTGGPFTFIGNGMTLNGVLHNGLFDDRVTPGQATELFTLDCCGDIGPGSAVINGVSYSRIFYGGQVSLTAFVPAIDWREGAFSIVVPFTLTGTLRGCATNPELIGPCDGGLLFDTFVTGQGTAVVNLFGFQVGDRLSLQATRVNYTFNEPVPEPATLVLLTTGLLGTAAAARRRRRKI